MAKRTRKKQSQHDQEVKRLARTLTREGWYVQADLPGYEQPKPVGDKGRIPDIEATKRGATRLIEVETTDSIEKDKQQIRSFRSSVAKRKRTTFDLVIADD